MVSLNDVLLAMSNIPVDDPIAEILGRGLQGGYKIIEYTGSLPITINANGDALLDYRIYGNTVQNGTPTPENPIMPIGCGERTENLFDYQTMAVSAISCYLTATGQEVTITGWRISDYIPCSGKEFTINKIGGDSPAVCLYDENKQFLTGKSYRTSGVAYKLPVTVSSATDAKYIRFSYVTLSDNLSEITITEGSTPPSEYIPYGYKLPLTSAGQDVDIYLGEGQSTRRIKKLVLDGTENWTKSTTYQGSFYASFILINSALQGLMCTHAEYTPIISTKEYVYGKCAELGAGVNKMLNLYLGDASWTVDDFKSYLAAQYAAGTPVTVWYVLAEPETAVVNEPLMKIGDYADTISMEQAGVSIPTINGSTVIDYDGTPKPSQMYVKYKGKEVQ